MNEGKNYLKAEIYQLIKEDESLFDFVLSASSDGLWCWDLEKPENEWMNAVFWKTLGYLPEEVSHIPKIWQNFIFAEDLKKVREIVYTNIKNPDFEYEQEVRYRHKDGSILWLICRGRFICNNMGKPIRMIGGHENITLSKKLDHQNTRLNSILEASSDLCFVLDSKGVFLDYRNNNNTKNDLYIPPTFFIGKNIKEVGFPEDILEAFLNAINKTLQTKTKTQIEYSLNIPKIGQQFYSLIISLFYYEPDIPPEVLCFVQNITENKLAELALKTSEERFRNAINATKEGIWEWNLETNEEFFSPRWCEIIGFDFTDTSFPHTFEAWSARIHQDDYGLVMKALKAHLEEGKVYDVEYRHLHKSGQYHWQSSRGQAVFDDKGKAIKMVGCISDISERKKAEALAQQMNHLHQTLLDNVPGYVVCRDHNGYFLFVNQAFSALFGKKPEEVIGLTDAAYGATQEEIEYYLAADRKVLESGEPLFIPEEVVLRADGTRGIFQATKVPIKIWGLENSAVLVVATDITDLKEIQAKLIDNQAQLLYKSQILSAIAQTTEKLLVGKNIDETLQESFELIGKTTQVDRISYFEKDTENQMMNYKVEWVVEGGIATKSDDSLHHASIDSMMEYLEPLIQNTHFQILAKDIKTPAIRKRLKKQHTLSILLIPVFVKNNFHGFIGFEDCRKERQWSPDELNTFNSLATSIANAIERMHNEIMIEESESNFRQINETIESVFWLYDNANKKYLYISPSCEKVLGIKQEDFYSGEYKKKEPVSEEDKDIFRKAEQSLLENNSYDITYKLTFENRITWINEKSYAIRNEKGELSRQTGICIDITEKIEKQTELEKLLNITNKQNERLNNFAHIVSHNIRSHSSNLTSLMDFVEASEDSEEQNLYLSKVRLSVDKLSETIKHLNQIITIQNSLDIPKQKICVYQEITSTLHILAVVMQETQAQIIYDIPKDITVNVIPAYFESILLNFITNAIKYRSPNRQAKIEISCKQNEEYLILSIKDNGLGIDLARHGSKLFGMYKVFHHHKDARGIGLFITKNQIEAMGGKIEVESEIDIGTTFHIYLPQN